MGETDEFEWDDSKDAANQRKHGVELIVAAAMFNDPDRLEQVSGRSTATETRLITVGRAFWRSLDLRVYLAGPEAPSYLAAPRPSD